MAKVKMHYQPDNLSHFTRPSISIGLELNQNAVVLQPNMISARNKVRFPGGLALQSFTNVQFQLPSSLQYSLTNQSPEVNTDGTAVQLDIKELNMVLTL